MTFVIWALPDIVMQFRMETSYGSLGEHQMKTTIATILIGLALCLSAGAQDKPEVAPTTPPAMHTCGPAGCTQADYEAAGCIGKPTCPNIQTQSEAYWGRADDPNSRISKENAARDAFRAKCEAEDTRRIMAGEQNFITSCASTPATSKPSHLEDYMPMVKHRPDGSILVTPVGGEPNFKPRTVVNTNGDIVESDSHGAVVVTRPDGSMHLATPGNYRVVPKNGEPWSWPIPPNPNDPGQNYAGSPEWQKKHGSMVTKPAQPPPMSRAGFPAPVNDQTKGRPLTPEELEAGRLKYEATPEGHAYWEKLRADPKYRAYEIRMKKGSIVAPVDDKNGVVVTPATGRPGDPNWEAAQKAKKGSMVVKPAWSATEPPPK